MKTKKLLVLIVSFSIMCVCLVDPALSQKEDLNSYRELESQITTLNLINGLYLTEEQMLTIIDLAKGAKKIKEDYLEHYSHRYDEATQPLEDLKSELINDKGYIDEDVKKKAQRVHNKDLHIKSEFAEEMRLIIDKTKNTLTENQIYLIRDFKPCLIPPKGPLRIGQSSDHTGFLEKLERIRSMSERDYLQKRYSMVDRVQGRIEDAPAYRLRGDQMSEEELRGKVIGIFDKVRSLSDVDFEMQKEEIAQEFYDIVHPSKKGRPVDIDRRIQSFLLTPSVISILEEKLASNE